MVLGTTILSWTNRSPSGLPPEAGTPCPLSRSFWPEELPGGIVSDFMPSSDGTSILAPEDRLGDGDRHLDQEVAVLALEVGMGLDRDDDRQVAALASLGAGFALSLEPELGPGVDAGRDLDDQVLRLAVAALDVDRGLAAADGRQEGDGQMGLDRSPAARLGRAATDRIRPSRSSKMPAPPRLSCAGAPLPGPGRTGRRTR